MLPNFTKVVNIPHNFTSTEKYEIYQLSSGDEKNHDNYFDVNLNYLNFYIWLCLFGNLCFHVIEKYNEYVISLFNFQLTCILKLNINKEPFWKQI